MWRREGHGHQSGDAWSPWSWKGREGPSLGPVGGARPWDPWTSDAWFPEQGRGEINFFNYIL